MYNVYKNVISMLLLFVLFSSFVMSQEQRIEDAIQKIMQTSSKDISEDINRNIDENFGQLDERLVSKTKTNFNRAVIAVIGGLSIVMFGYAWINNRITKRYDLTFYEKMIDSKLDKIKTYPYVVQPQSSYISVTRQQFGERYASPQKYFEKVIDSPIIQSLQRQVSGLQKKLEEKELDDSKSIFYKSIFTGGKDNIKVPLKKKVKALIISVLVVIFLLVMLYVYLRYRTNVLSNVDAFGFFKNIIGGV